MRRIGITMMTVALLVLFLMIGVLPPAYAETSTAEDIATIKTKAEQGDAEAQNKLGLMYFSGNGVARDYKQAFTWSTKAAEQGNVDAQYNLGIMYHTGQGVAQNYKKAVFWVTKAAEQGYADAQYNLGIM